jgi:uncharacterized BrkB/YihY/UPF0761 family membrane protein
MSYAQLGDALIENLVVFLFEPRTTILGQFLHLAGWFVGISLILANAFKGIFQTTYRNVLPGATLTGATMTAVSFLFHAYIIPASFFFGTAGAFAAVMLWAACSIGISGGGFCLTYMWLERRGIQTAVREFVFRLESPATPPDHADNRLPG